VLVQDLTSISELLVVEPNLEYKRENRAPYFQSSLNRGVGFKPVPATARNNRHLQDLHVEPPKKNFVIWNQNSDKVGNHGCYVTTPSFVI
jgi:hypothetical protein